MQSVRSVATSSTVFWKWSSWFICKLDASSVSLLGMQTMSTKTKQTQSIVLNQYSRLSFCHSHLLLWMQTCLNVFCVIVSTCLLDWPIGRAWLRVLFFCFYVNCITPSHRLASVRVEIPVPISISRILHKSHELHKLRLFNLQLIFKLLSYL